MLSIGQYVIMFAGSADATYACVSCIGYAIAEVLQMASVAASAAPEAYASNAACRPLLQFLEHQALCEFASMTLGKPALLVHTYNAVNSSAACFLAGAASTSVRRCVELILN